MRSPTKNLFMKEQVPRYEIMKDRSDQQTDRLCQREVSHLQENNFKTEKIIDQPTNQQTD